MSAARIQEAKLTIFSHFMLTLLEQLQRLTPRGEMAWTPDLSVSVGLETRTQAEPYFWDGRRRGGDPARPFLLFQYTLAGSGIYTEAGTVHTIAPGSAFTAVVPSAHVYTLPAQSPAWTFFFLILRHPYAVQRLTQARQRIGPVLALTPSDLLLARAVSLFEGVAARSFHDSWAAEAALFEFLFEYERLTQRRLYPQAERESMLEEVRRFVLTHREADVTALAAQSGQSRSHFSHRFKAVTGLPPAQWVRQIQLEEATRQLLATDHKLEAVAQASGFADANHLCKAFRRRYHLSPGEFRRQMR